MRLTIDIPDNVLKDMASRPGLSAARILNYAAKLLDEAPDNENQDHEVYAGSLREICPLVDALYAGARSAYYFPPKE